METATLGKTGLAVTRLGIGLGGIGRWSPMADVDEAGRLLNGALDGGINFLDTAACYRTSEELIGRTIAHRRDEYVLATKAGHVTGGYSGEEWTAKTVADSIDRSLRRLRTDRVDLMQLHTCDLEVLKRGEVVDALLHAKRQGKTRFVGYSGDDKAALWAIESGLFDTLQTSFSVVDQRARTRLFGSVEDAGLGLIAKRPIGKAVWDVPGDTSGYPEELVRRAQAMAEKGPIPGAPDDPVELALGFVLAHEEVDTALVGTVNPAHLKGNIEVVQDRLPISRDAVEELHRRFEELDRGWAQMR